MKAYVFPGQGSQVKGMGEGLFDKFSGLTAKADSILGYSIKELCLYDKNNTLGQTQFTQPALYMVDYLLYLKHIEETGDVPAYVAGHSLGEYAALAAAGVFDFETGLQLVMKRGALMSQATGGGMAAVMGMTEEEIKKTISDYQLTTIDVANFNAPGQIIISGIKEDIAASKEVFEKAGVSRFIPLSVSGAFHSRYMEEAKNEFARFLESFNFSKPKIPVIANFTARPYTEASIKKNMIEQITGSVRWIESIRYLMGKGVDEFKEFGPKPVLTGMIVQIRKKCEPLIVNETEEAPQTAEPTAGGSGKISPEHLGSVDFKKDFNLKYAYVTGAMYKGVSSKELVVAVGKAGMMGFLGTGGVEPDEVENDIRYIQGQLTSGEAYGMNLLADMANPRKEEELVLLYLKHGIKTVEAAAFIQMTPALVLYRLKGLKKAADGTVICEHKILGKVSRPEVARGFMSPPPERVVHKLLAEGKVTSEEAELARQVPVADYIVVEADSAGHTDMGVAYTLMPAMLVLRDLLMREYNYKKKIGVGAAGGIGTPEAAAAAFILGADFIVTGSINQCTIEANTSEMVKDLLQASNVQDTEYAPAGDMFEMGAKVQVLKKGLFFPARANKLYELYKQYNSLDEIDEKTRQQIQEKYLHRSFDEVWEETKKYLSKTNPDELTRAEGNPKQKMAHIFKWYFIHSARLARKGSLEQKVDYQVHCGPALGAFNQWVKGTGLEEWRSRHVAEIGIKLLKETAVLLKSRFEQIMTG